MREIKFRGKNKDGNWVYGYFVRTPIGNCFIESILGFITEVDCKTVGQYTGLKDKNGKEIYEGDIVKAEGLISIRVRPVIFKNGMFCIVGESALLPLNEYVEKGNELEVVGNVYDNPEL